MEKNEEIQSPQRSHVLKHAKCAQFSYSRSITRVLSLPRDHRFMFSLLLSGSFQLPFRGAAPRLPPPQPFLRPFLSLSRRQMTSARIGRPEQTADRTIRCRYVASQAASTLSASGGTFFASRPTAAHDVKYCGCRGAAAEAARNGEMSHRPLTGSRLMTVFSAD